MGLQGFRCSSIIMFYLCLTTSFIFLYAKGEVYFVGDDRYGWDDFFDFSNWTHGKEFHVGDVLVFKYESSLHNVLQVDSTAYENCIKDSYAQRFTSGNDSVVLEEGRAWFICGVGDHCENGQRLQIAATP
ncbi:mavicyanin [Cajanus cajan]|uniref:Basic blue protein n=1 Tax=Cajanus cajan TaxID=3821 RepID=A0A151T3R2_CAJCA|nr:mavicyanin [Cajanus cajan]KYP61677.1 Basic blue protein [Cajanus cajan]